MPCAIKETFKRHFRCCTPWFKPNGKDKYDWKDIKTIIKSDPLEHEEPKEPIWHNNYSIYLIFLISLVISIACPTFSGIPAIVAGFIAIYNATNQILAKVRSENRQKWIDDVRNSLAEAITYMRIDDSTYQTETPSTSSCGDDENQKAERIRIRLELLMNPSEKDHRTIGYLLRKAYRVKKMALIDEYIETNLKDLLDEIIDINAQENTICKIKDIDKLVSWLIRLSNATLKREWELVKNAK